jgi:ABC-type transport system involved in multi-copper enzyme maturation permease subunit
MSLGRVFTIMANVFREVIRDRILYLVGLYALLMAMAVRLLPEVAAATETKILLDLGLAAMQVIGLVITVFLGTGLVNKEIEKRTVLVMIAKPISRLEFIVGKHLGLSAVLAVLVAVMTVVFLAIAVLAKAAFVLPNILISSFFLWLQLSLLTAVAIAFSVFTSSLLATLLTFGVFLMGSFSANLVALGVQSKNPAIEAFTRNLYLVLPDLARLDLKNQAVYGKLPATDMLLGNAGYGLLYMVVLLMIASLIFSSRDF